MADLHELSASLQEAAHPYSIIYEAELMDQDLIRIA